MARLSANFGYVHQPVLADPSISITAKAVYALLASYADRSGFSYPGRKRLASELGVSVPTVRRALAELVEAGVIRRFDRTAVDGRQTSSMTVLIEESRGVISDPPGGVISDPQNRTTNNITTRSGRVHMRSRS